MANENGENGYHGYRFLVDAQNSRQFAIRYDHGQPKPPLQVFAQKPGEQGFKSNETTFAMDDEVHFFETQSRELTVATTLFQITADDSAKHFSIKQSSVSYHVLVAVENDTPVVKYHMTAESVKDLTNLGFSPNFPRQFKNSVTASVYQDFLENGPEVLGELPFPPHQFDGAGIARSSLQGSTSLPPLGNEWPDEVRPIDTDRLLPRPSNDFNKGTTTIPRPVDYKISDSTIESVIKQFCKDLTALARQGKLDPVVGRESETNQALKVLTRRKQSSLCFTGEAGVGKSAMFSAVAQRIVDDQNLPESIRNARVLELDLQAMNAGAKFRGQFEEKLKPLIDGLAEREGVLKGRKIILAIDELHSQLTAGKAEGGSDAGNMMKPFLTTKGVSTMGTTTDEEYKKHIEKDPALGSRFEQMRLTPPNEADTVTIIKRLWPLTKEHNHLKQDLSDDDISYIVTMCNRYAPQEAQPRKSEKVMNMAAASAEFDGRDAINKNDVLAAIAQMSHLSVDFLNQSDHERFLKLETELPKEVLGQPELQRISDGLIGSRSGLNDPNQPWGCFVLQGPTGTGKTETCKALARYLFGTEDALIKLDMGEYAEKHTVSRLIGAPPGYVGFDSAEPALTEKIRQRPYSILLLDEIEKAHPDVFNTFLPILNDGKMTDNQGKTVLFNNVIVVMTTNAGAAKVMDLLQGKGGMSFGDNDKDPEKLAAELERIYSKARTVAEKGPFRPEMINRIEELGGFITYRPLNKEVVSNLAVRELKKINDRLGSAAGANLKGVTVEVSAEVMAQIAKDGYNPSMGARPLRKVIREKVANPLGKWLMGNKDKVAAQLAEHGALKLVINSLTKFEPELVMASPAVSNDNVTEAAAPVVTKARKPRAPKP